MRISTAALALTVVTTVFVIIPWVCVVANAAFGWPTVIFPGSSALGGVLIVVGIVGALMCSRMFRVVGHGTPIPTEPARQLMESGPYRFSRNPIYIADLAILLGMALHRGELMLFVYSATFAVAAQLWVVYHEEPVLERRFGDHYRAYCEVVPRWVGGRGPDRGIV